MIDSTKLTPTPMQTAPPVLIQDIISVLEAIAPPHLQESYDNAGLIVGHPQTPVSGILFCLDSTEAIVD